MAQFRRRKKLPKRGLQLRLTMKFVGVTALGLTLQLLAVMVVLGELAVELPQDGNILLDLVPWALARVFVASLVVFLPIIFVVGVLTTFRIAGPLYRFEQFLKAILRGERPEDIRLRRGDELTDLAQILNEATEPMRRRGGAAAAPRARVDAALSAPPAALPNETAPDEAKAPARRG